MNHLPPAGGPVTRTRPILLRCLLALLLLAPAGAHAQAPAWATATSGNNAQPPAGGTSATRATATDPATGNVYATGYFTGTITFGSTRLTSAGGNDLFVAKWDAAAEAWTSAVSGGGTGTDYGLGIAVSNAGGTANVYVTGSFASGTSASIAGTALAGAGQSDVFVAKYTDAGLGLTTTNGGAVSGGGTSDDSGQSIAVGSAGGLASVYVTGSFTTSASIAGTPLTGPGMAEASSTDLFVAKYSDMGTGLSTTNGGAVSGGGTGADVGQGIAVSSAGGTASVYVTGSFASGTSASIAGTTLAGAGNTDVFVAKYTDAGLGLTTANGGAVSGGSTSTDAGQGIAVSSDGGVASVYVTGFFASGASASIAGTTLPGVGTNNDLFVAKYTDAGTGLSTTNGGAVSGGGLGTDVGNGIAVSRAGGTASVYVTGNFINSASIAGTSLSGAGNQDVFVAKYTDAGAGLSTTNGGAVGGGGTSGDFGLGIAVSGTVVYAGAATGTAVARFGSPARLAPLSSAVLARLDAGTLGYLGTEGPLQGGTSATLATATDPATGNVYVTGNYTGTVGFGSTRLVSAGGDDVFVAKWDASAGAWTSAVSGGGTNNDSGNGIAVSSTGGTASVYVTGQFNSGTNASIAGTSLAGAGGNDVFVAKYTDVGLGLTTANGGAVSGGGTSTDIGQGIAVSSAGGTASVYVTGFFASSASVSIAGTALAAVGGIDLFVAKYTDAGTGLSTTNGGAIGGGGAGADGGNAIAVSRAGGTTSVYVTGQFGSGTNASIAGTTLGGTGANNYDMFVAKYTDVGVGLTATNGGAVSGGGTEADYGNGIAVNSTGGTTSVYVTGQFGSGTKASIAGTSLAGAGGQDIFVAKYTDAGTGLSTTNGGAMSGGGTNNDFGYGIAVSSNGGVANVYATGSFTSNTKASIAGTPLTGVGIHYDVFVAKYTDAGAGLSTTNGGALSGGSPGTDIGQGVAIAGQRVYVGGSIMPGASFGSTTLANASGSQANVLARIDAAGAATPLPVTLAMFTATAQGPAAVVLAWATASEVSSARFEVERSLDGTAFSKIGMVAAAGSSTAAHTYALTDATLPVGASLLYYRLRQVDADGSAHYSPVRSVARAGAGLGLYPNPATAGATLLGAQPGTRVQVLDALGRLVLTGTTDAAGTTALAWPAGLPAGVYVVRAGPQATRLVVE